MKTLFEIIRTHIKLFLGKGVRKSYSQFGEDMIVWHLLRQKKGVYIDVGAYHPILYSNTYAFYKNGWSGIAIDPNPLCGKIFRWFRPRDKFINAAAGVSGEGLYYQYNDSAYNSFSSTLQGGKNIRLIRKTTMSIRPLSELLREIKQIDFMNIDVEGMDIRVLESHNWEIKPTIIAVEGLFGGEAYKFLSKQGYILKVDIGMTMIFELRKSA